MNSITRTFYHLYAKRSARWRNCCSGQKEFSIGGLQRERQTQALRNLDGLKAALERSAGSACRCRKKWPHPEAQQQESLQGDWNWRGSRKREREREERKANRKASLQLRQRLSSCTKKNQCVQRPLIQPCVLSRKIKIKFIGHKHRMRGDCAECTIGPTDQIKSKVFYNGTSSAGNVFVDFSRLKIGITRWSDLSRIN